MQQAPRSGNLLLCVCMGRRVRGHLLGYFASQYLDHGVNTTQQRLRHVFAQGRPQSLFGTGTVDRSREC